MIQMVHLKRLQKLPLVWRAVEGEEDYVMTISTPIAKKDNIL